MLPVFSLGTSQFSVFSYKEKCNGIRTDMTSGAEIIGGVYKIPYLDFFLYLLHDIKGIFIGICMGNADNESMRKSL